MSMSRKNFFFFLTFFFLFVSQTGYIFASEDDFGLETPVPPPIEYTLPYPGLLPNHSFYFLKRARDNVMGFLTSNPVKKAEFFLLQSDKQVEATYLLWEQDSKNTELMLVTFREAEKHFHAAIVETDAAKKQGMDIHDLHQRLTLANLKYLERGELIEHSLEKEEKEKFAVEIKKMQELGKEVTALKP